MLESQPAAAAGTTADTQPTCMLQWEDPRQKNLGHTTCSRRQGIPCNSSKRLCSCPLGTCGAAAPCCQPSAAAAPAKVAVSPSELLLPAAAPDADAAPAADLPISCLPAAAACCALGPSLRPAAAVEGVHWVRAGCCCCCGGCSTFAGCVAQNLQHRQLELLAAGCEPNCLLCGPAGQLAG